MTQAPSIKKVQYNRETDHSFRGSESVDQEYTEQINHDGPAARIVFETGNWIEYRKIDDKRMEECVFVEVTHPTGQREAILEDSIELSLLNIPTADEFYKAVDTPIHVYQEIGTVEDAEREWPNIIPALQEGSDE